MGHTNTHELFHALLVCVHIMEGFNVCSLCSLNDLEEFIKVTRGGLSVEVPEGEYETLVSVMHHLLAVRDRQPSTDGMFEPLNQTIELLKTFHEEMPELVYQQLEVSMCENICVSIKFNL